MLEIDQGFKKTKTVAIIPAAGSGVRMQTDRAKQFLEIEGKPLLAITLQPFQACGAVDAVVVVVPAAEVDFCRNEIIEKYDLHKVKKVVAGGARRQDSVRQGLEAIDGEYDLALIHDGVRPVISKMDLERIIDSAKTLGAVISGLPAKETVKEVDRNKRVTKTYDRNGVWLVQTPQVFLYDDIFKAHQRAFHENWPEATDDSFLIEEMGIPVSVTMGSEQNIKVTTPNDLALAKFFLASLNNELVES